MVVVPAGGGTGRESAAGSNVDGVPMGWNDGGMDCVSCLDDDGTALTLTMDEPYGA